MSKELTPLEALKSFLGTCGWYDDEFKKRYDLVETALKALEIIKSKEMLYVFNSPYGKCFICFNTTAVEIPQEEYDLLKEVLKR